MFTIKYHFRYGTSRYYTVKGGIDNAYDMARDASWENSILYVEVFGETALLRTYKDGERVQR